MAVSAVWNVQSPHRDDIQASVWLPAGRARAVIQVFHGMAEHIARYDRPATELARRGYAVVGHNHQGHGRETPREKLGYFYDKDGWINIMEDGYAVTQMIKKRFPGIPVVLLGHSMGSFLAREYVLRYGDALGGLILSGTGWYPAPVCSAGALVAGVANPKKPAPFVDKMAFSGNNKAFTPARTPFDWLSRDKAEVDRYIADPYCGFTFTGRAFRDFFEGLRALTKLERLNAMPVKLPVYFMSGDRDPVGQMGKGVLEVAAQFRQAGLTDVSVHLYDGARHELFNETNRDEVLHELTVWLDEHFR